MNWDDYRYFLAVANEGNLKRAAAALKVDQATVGRRLNSLQSRLGTKLLEKRSDGFFLTVAGSRILENVAAAEDAMFAIDRAILGRDEKVEGIVKIALPAALANYWLLEYLQPFLRKHPGLELQFLTGPELLNLSRRQADFALRLVRPKQGELRARKIGAIRLGLYGFAETSAKKEIGESPFVGLFENARSDFESAYLESLDLKTRICLRFSAWESVAIAISAGLGIGILPTFIAKNRPGLRLLHEESAAIPLWLVVHPEVAKSARVRATIDCLSGILHR